MSGISGPETHLPADRQVLHNTTYDKTNLLVILGRDQSERRIANDEAGILWGNQ